MDKKISSVVLTKNEGQNLARCLKSLLWCDEILVVDDNSEDNTISIAKKFGVKIYSRSLAKDFAAQRNFGLEKASNEWVLFVDADEVVPFSLQDEILTTIADANKKAFLIQRKDILWGKMLNYGETGNMRLIRLARKDDGVWVGRVHERWMIHEQIGKLRFGLLHYPHQSIGKFINDVNYYTDLRAEELYDQNKRVLLWEIILYPKLKFLKNYLLNLGFIDGVPGLIVAVIMSFHSFLVRAKLWFLWREKK